MFGSLADALSGYLRVIRWDQRGSGRSERRGPYSVAGAVADLDAVRGHFGLAKTALLGHSWARRWRCGTRWTTQTGSAPWPMSPAPRSSVGTYSPSCERRSLRCHTLVSNRLTLIVSIG
jgi:alpha/beta hydrolase fold